MILNESDAQRQRQFLDLTNRERECLRMITLGYTAKYLARKLNISSRTVEKHVANIKTKLGVRMKSQLIELWHEHESEI